MAGQVPGGGVPGMGMFGGGPSPAEGQNNAGGIPQLGGPSPQVGPMPPLGGFSNQPMSGTGQSFQTPVAGMVPKPPQVANPIASGVPQMANDAGMATGMSGAMNNGMTKPPQPAPMPPMPMAQPPQTAVGNQNRMTVHNPTGTGATQASQMAAAKRPIPANQPTKKVGAMPPTPSKVPGPPK